MKKYGKILKVVVAVVLLFLVIAVSGTGLYLHDYYHAEASAIACLSADYSHVKIVEKEGKEITFAPEKPVAGLIFYPGGKVEYQAYAPMMEALAEKGIFCVLVHMPGNLAVLDANAATRVQEQYPDIHDWYLAGHSLGGVMAASYAADHPDEVDGLILLASYATKNMKDSALPVLCVYASEDQVLSQDACDHNDVNLPEDYQLLTIEGGCHAYFGDYGVQDGDGQPTISQQEQMGQVVQAISRFVLGE